MDKLMRVASMQSTDIEATAKDLLIMWEDTVVCCVNFDTGLYDIITERQYKEFMWRAKDLGIEVYESPCENKIRKAMSRLVIPDSFEEVSGKVTFPTVDLVYITAVLKDFYNC